MQRTRSSGSRRGERGPVWWGGVGVVVVVVVVMVVNRVSYLVCHPGLDRET